MVKLFWVVSTENGPDIELSGLSIGTEMAIRSPQACPIAGYQIKQRVCRGVEGGVGEVTQDSQMGVPEIDDWLSLVLILLGKHPHVLLLKV